MTTVSNERKEPPEEFNLLRKSGRGSEAFLAMSMVEDAGW
jgi:hypothetical protein